MTPAIQTYDSWISSLSFYRSWPVRKRWLRFAVSLLSLAAVLGMRHGYLTNDQAVFFSGMVFAVGIAAGWLRAETPAIARIGWPIWQRVAATCMALALVEGGYVVCGRVPSWTGSEAGLTAEQLPRVVTYAEAQGDPHAFAQWWRAYSSEWRRHADLIEVRAVNQPVPYHFRPNTSRPFFRGEIHVNSLGLCDREVPHDKGNRYRIVVMGSSHAQCPPIEPGDQPWPAKLERCIRESMPVGREVEVLNAGAAGYTIEHNLHRLQEVVLPLKPDMIITYFGYNEFSYFQDEFRLPAIPPQPRSRPLTLIGNAEWRFNQWLARQMSSSEPLADAAALQPRLADCRLARAYREYQRLTQEHGVTLVVCNFCMAVNEHSPAEAIQFYEQGFPDVHYMIEANRLNSLVQKAVFIDAPGCRLIDVQPELDGAWEHAYLDLVHHSEVGKEQLAKNVCREISDLLKSATPSKSSSPADQLVEQDDARQRRL